jgi:riboflavin kinase/FMN adenylyltransferase
MTVVTAPAGLERVPRGVAIGTFDGVHLGHRRVLDAVRATGLRPTVITFDPHPRAFFGTPVELLTPVERRLELLSDAGIDDILLLRFDEALAGLEPEEFAETMLRGIAAEVVVVGEGFRFGRARRGDTALLERLGFDVRLVPLVESVSSTHIRALLAAGEVASAARLLGRPPEVEGIVVLGDQRGRLLGFPTANLDTPSGVLVPELGVYAGWTLGHRTAISIGTNPHYGGTERRVEGHLVDFDGDLYGRRLVFELWDRLRDQAVFGSEAELVDAIGADVAATRAADRPA